jgi:hypothetical protein
MGNILSAIRLVFMEKRYKFLNFQRLGDNIRISYKMKHITINNWDFIIRGESIILSNFFRKMPNNEVVDVMTSNKKRIKKGNSIYVISENKSRSK